MAGRVRNLVRNIIKPKTITTSNHCMNLIRQCDYENYMCTLFLPKKLIPAAVAIRAFNVEVARIEDVVRDKELGEMRLQWFMDELNKVFEGKPRNHPVLMELHKTLQNTKVSKHYLKRLVASRLRRIRQPEFPSLETIEEYAEQSVSPIYYMLLQLHNVNDMHVDHYASHLGKAQGIMTVLRSIPYYRSKRINVLPGDVLLNHGLSSEAMFRKTQSEKMQDCIYDVASQAMLHLNKAKTLDSKGKVDRKIKNIFLPRIYVQSYLEKLEQNNFDVDHPALRKSDVTNLLKLFFVALYAR